MIEYREETIENILFEFNGMLEKHMEEMNYFVRQGSKFNPDYSRYLKMQEMGKLLVITATEAGKLVGYIVFNVDTHRRFRDTVYASEDLYYVAPEYRRRGIAKQLFIEAERVLKDYGVTYVLATVKTYMPHDKLLEDSGYECFERVYGKKLG